MNKQVAAIFKIGNSKDIPDIPDHFSSDAKSFLKLCLQRDPAARPTAAQLMDHPFVQDQTLTKATKSRLFRDTLPSLSAGTPRTVWFFFIYSVFFSFYILASSELKTACYFRSYVLEHLIMGIFKFILNQFLKTFNECRSYTT